MKTSCDPCRARIRQTRREGWKHTRPIRLRQHVGGPVATSMISWTLLSLPRKRCTVKCVKRAARKNNMIMWFRGQGHVLHDGAEPYVSRSGNTLCSEWQRVHRHSRVKENHSFAAHRTQEVHHLLWHGSGNKHCLSVRCGFKYPTRRSHLSRTSRQNL